jgi:hypothetical protein
MSELFKRTRFIQRLKQPTGLFEGPLSHTPQFSQDLRAALAPLFTLDYMGAYEFENGAVYEALKGLYLGRGKLEAAKYVVTIQPTPSDLFELKRDATREPFGINDPDELREYLRPRQIAFARGSKPLDVSYYILAPRQTVDRVKDIVEILSKGDGDRALFEPANPHRSGVGISYVKDIVGWLELDNGFFIFSDFSMFSRVCKFFGVSHSLEPNVQSNKVGASLNRLGVTTDSLVVDEDGKGTFHAKIVGVNSAYRGEVYNICGHGNSYRSAVRNLGKRIRRSQSEGTFFRP